MGNIKNGAQHSEKHITIQNVASGSMCLSLIVWSALDTKASVLELFPDDKILVLFTSFTEVCTFCISTL
ncbi:hypothetical protein BpHYR1_019941 [Brachionus plicatilis]|uniref:Uncharacterized protein n=1 Tax=Brachionus plicatilis TaxID=10195 RepID=A0A3M7T373_BRAPC|nr:hypothetical protein BpHYR1_019941 [Brachionus plicatilis]